MGHLTAKSMIKLTGEEKKAKHTARGSPSDPFASKSGRLR